MNHILRKQCLEVQFKLALSRKRLSLYLAAAEVSCVARLAPESLFV